MKPGTSECLQYDTRYQAITLDDAIGSFVDLTLEDDDKPPEKEKTEADVSLLSILLYAQSFRKNSYLGALPNPRMQSVPQASEAAAEEGGPAERVHRSGSGRCSNG